MRYLLTRTKPLTLHRGTQRRLALVIDADPDSRRSLMRALSQLDTAPIGFATPGDALRWLDDNRAPVLVSVDLSLSIAGQRLCGLLREHPKLVNVPILGVTACRPMDDDQALGADVLLGKPVVEAEYLRTAAQLMVPWRSPVQAALGEASAL